MACHASHLPWHEIRIRFLTVAVEAAPRDLWVPLYGSIVLTGIGAALPGMRQRLEAELRPLRGTSTMPRGLAARVVSSPDNIHPELAAWRGAAFCSRKWASTDEGWLLAARFSRNTSLATREAMRQAGCEKAQWHTQPNLNSKPVVSMSYS